jgi:hypothetical protein
MSAGQARPGSHSAQQPVKVSEMTESRFPSLPEHTALVLALLAGCGSPLPFVRGKAQTPKPRKGDLRFVARLMGSQICLCAASRPGSQVPCAG